MRRVFTDALISGSVLLLLLVALVLIDPRVKEHVTGVIGSSPASAAVRAGNQLEDVATTLVVAARDQSIDHAPMMIFVVAATVLFLAMIRT